MCGRRRTEDSGSVGSEEKGGEGSPPPCWRSEPVCHAGKAGRDGPAAGAGRAEGQAEGDRVAALSAGYEGARPAWEGGQFGRGSDGDGSRGAGAALRPCDSTVHEAPGSWKGPRPTGTEMKGSEEGALQWWAGGQGRGRVAPVG